MEKKNTSIKSFLIYGSVRHLGIRAFGHLGFWASGLLGICASGLVEHCQVFHKIIQRQKT